MEHLAYCDKKANELEKIFDGTKTMLIRGAAGRKLPHGKAQVDEVIYLIENDGSGRIVAKGKISNVFNSDKLTEEESRKLIMENMEKLQLTNSQLARWAGKRYLCLVEIRDVKKIDPFSYERAGNMDDWIIVNSIDEIKIAIDKS